MTRSHCPVGAARMGIYFHLSLLISLLSIISLWVAKVTDLCSSVFIRLLRKRESSLSTPYPICMTFSPKVSWHSAANGVFITPGPGETLSREMLRKVQGKQTFMWLQTKMRQVLSSQLQIVLSVCINLTGSGPPLPSHSKSPWQCSVRGPTRMIPLHCFGIILDEIWDHFPKFSSANCRFDIRPWTKPPDTGLPMLIGCLRRPPQMNSPLLKNPTVRQASAF